MKNNKSELRKYAKQIRMASNIEAISEAILAKLQALDVYKNAENILTYSPLEGEIQLDLVNFTGGKNWVFPKVEGDFLKTYVVEDILELKEGAFNVLEPFECEKVEANKIDLAIIPALMVDLKGHRLGYGKGFYDRLMPSLNCPKIVLIQDKLITDCLPVNEHDKEADYILSEKRFIKV